MISRRDFIKLISLLGLSPLAGCVNEQEVSMQLGDLVARWAKGGHLSASEADYVRVRLNEMESMSALVSGWTSGGATDPYFPVLRAQQAFFDIPSLNAFSVVGSGLVSVPSGSLPTPFTWGYRVGKSEVLSWSASDPDFVIPKNPPLNFLIFGTINVAVGPTRLRLWTRFRNDTYELQLDVPLSGSNSSKVNFSFVQNLFTYAAGIGLGVSHNSGSPIDCGANMTFIPVSHGSQVT